MIEWVWRDFYEYWYMILFLTVLLVNNEVKYYWFLGHVIQHMRLSLKSLYIACGRVYLLNSNECWYLFGQWYFPAYDISTNQTGIQGLRFFCRFSAFTSEPLFSHHR
jgi:hypothetical protein